MSPRPAALVLTGFASLSVVVALAGCTTTGANGTDGASGGGDSALSGPYTDGTYTESGSYISPGGEESVDVEITLADDIITDVVVTTHFDNPNTEQYQTAFAGGIANEVVGKNIDDITVSKVAGSSLTSGGFNEAVEAIKADAQS
jgi:hypothetical protein